MDDLMRFDLDGDMRNDIDVAWFADGAAKLEHLVLETHDPQTATVDPWPRHIPAGLLSGDMPMLEFVELATFAVGNGDCLGSSPLAIVVGNHPVEGEQPFTICHSDPGDAFFDGDETLCITSATIQDSVCREPCDGLCWEFSFTPEVCGTDGVTYSSRCMLEKEACLIRDSTLRVLTEGACPTGDTSDTEESSGLSTTAIIVISIASAAAGSILFVLTYRYFGRGMAKTYEYFQLERR
jgi:hypothetical protein